EKPPIAALIMAIRAAGQSLPFDTNTSQQTTPPLSSSSSLSPLSSPTKDDHVTFVAFRHSLRQLLLERASQLYRVDVQRIGSVILLRRYLSYQWHNKLDEGHQFEIACTQ